MRYAKTLIVSSTLAAAALALAACANHDTAAHAKVTPPTVPASQPVNPDRPHWVQSAQLQSVMQQLSGLHGALPTKDLPQDAESPSGWNAKTAMAAAGALGDALATQAMRIPASVSGKSMTDADRAAFADQAHALHDQAVELRDAARANKVEQVQAAYDKINTTCFACHSRFRDLAGELEFRKAAAPAELPLAIGQ